MLSKLLIPLALMASATTSVMASESTDPAALSTEVAAVENAFAATMAKRDFEGFGSFIADDTVFMAGATALRGKQAVLDAWKRYYEAEAAPFSWRSQSVQVLEAGDLALSHGPVFAADGRQIGNFNSIWRRQDNGSWKIIFDHGSEHCPSPAAE